MLPIVFVLTASVAFGQNAAPPPAFEVASVKVSAPLPGGAIMFGSGSMRGGPGSSDPGRITYNSVTLRAVTARAYNVKEYQSRLDVQPRSEPRPSGSGQGTK